MAIREFSPDGTPRAKIAFIGGFPEADGLVWFERRNFECKPSTAEELRGAKFVAQLDAVIWSQDPKRLNKLPQELKVVAANLLNHDVRVYIRLAAARDLVVNALIEDSIPVANLRREQWDKTPLDRRERENSFLMPCVYIFESASSWPDIATVVCDRPAGPPPNLGLNIEKRVLRSRLGLDGHEERILLLQRAFWNCSDLRLTLLEGGISGAPVFKAYASLQAGLVPRDVTGTAHPHLYFVKIGPRKKIVDEYDKYIWQISDYVPFHLRPRLRLDRCNLGYTQGILVGDFAEGTESLIACARGARCGHAISNLFDKTLGGWRKQTVPDTGRSLSSYLEKRWRKEGANLLIEVPTARAVVVRRLGGNTDILSLKMIFEKYGSTFPMIAPAHGDMHAKNVLVRHGDAILIDFEKLETAYPLTYDPASLEAGLLVDGFIKDLQRKRLTPHGLLNLIQPLYERSAVQASGTTRCRRGDPAEWYYDAVNQIRTLSRDAENARGQYALTLALCLIRKGCNTHTNFEDGAPNATRAIAFFLGQKILREWAKKPRKATPSKRGK